MDLTALINRLGTLVTSSPQILGQVVRAPTGGFQVPVDSSTELVSRLTSVVSGQIYPVSLRESPTFPNLVYTLVSSRVEQIDGYRITQSDRYVLELRSTAYSDMLTKMAAIKTALDASSFAIEFNDLAFDWDENQLHYRCSIDLEFTYLSTSSQAMPCAFVYCIDRTAGENQVDNLVAQRVQNSYGIVVLTKTGNMGALLNSIMTTLLGWQQGTGDSFEYVTGTNLQGVAGLEVWREIYRDAEYIKQAQGA